VRYDTVIWDWNGTLLDDATLCRTVMNSLLAEAGLPRLSVHRYQAVFDFPVEVYYRRIGFALDTHAFEHLGSQFMAGYERARHTCRLRSGTRKALARLQQAGIAQAMLSAYPQLTLDAVLRERGLHQHFTHVVGASDHYGRGKTKQAHVLRAQLPASRKIALIGDTLHDAEVARSIGADCLLIRGGHQARGRLEASGCPVFSSLVAAAAWVTGETTNVR